MNRKTYEDVFTFTNIYKAWRKSRKNVQWKGTVQAYKTTAISRIYETKAKLDAGRFKTGNFHRFTIMERGKLRHIKSVNIEERVVQRVLCDEVLVPTLRAKFIYDNAACVKGKGTHFALGRMKANLHRYWKRYGTNRGYILQWDFHHYFDTIPHDQAKRAILPLIGDRRLGNLYAKLIDDFDGDEGLGLGSQISQITALYYPHKLDDMFAYDERAFATARFMDDGYVISPDLGFLRECLASLRIKVGELGITINEGKTHIRKLNGTFQFLKARFSLYDDGSVKVKPNARNFTRNCRKLRRMFAMVREGKMEQAYVDGVFKTTYGNLRNYDSHSQMFRYLGLYNDLMRGEKDGLRLL